MMFIYYEIYLLRFFDIKKKGFDEQEFMVLRKKEIFLFI